MYTNQSSSNVRAALKSWLNNVLSSCLRQLQISKIHGKALVVAIQKRKKAIEDLKSY